MCQYELNKKKNSLQRENNKEICLTRSSFECGSFNLFLNKNNEQWKWCLDRVECNKNEYNDMCVSWLRWRRKSLPTYIHMRFELTANHQIIYEAPSTKNKLFTYCPIEKKTYWELFHFGKRTHNRKLFIAEYCRNRRTLDVRSKIDQSNTKCFMIFVSFSFDFPKTTFSESKFNNQIFVVDFFWLKCRSGWCVVIKSFYVAITLKILMFRKKGACYMNYVFT